MNKTKICIRNSISAAVNLSIIALVIYSIRTFYVGGGDGNMTVVGSALFRYFTNLSNILVAVMAAIVLPFNIRSVVSGSNCLPQWVIICKFVGTVAVTVTLLTVVFFLGPTMGYGMMFVGVCLYLHGIVPVLSIASFVILECSTPLMKKYTWLGVIPTALYSIVYLIAVVFVKVWPDFYGFTFGGKMWVTPISILVMYIATYVFAVGIRALHSFFYNRTNDGDYPKA